MATSGDMARTLALQGDVRDLKDRFSTLEQQVGGVAEAIEDLASHQKQAKPAPAWWPTMGEPEFGERWPEFLTWLRDVWVACYPNDARHLTVCWMNHPPAVAALTATWRTWQAAYLNRAADARDDAQWQTQWRRDLTAVVADELRLCKDGHKPAGALDDDVLATLR